MRVLCLHGSNHCGHTFYTQLNALERRLREHHGIELVFCDSPILDTPEKSTTPSPEPDNLELSMAELGLAAANRSRHLHRKWFELGEKNVGMDASMVHIQQIWNQSRDSRPFSGILALEQGAALAGVIARLQLTSRYQNDPWFFQGLRFVIFISGFDVGLPMMQPLHHDIEINMDNEELENFSEEDENDLDPASSIETLHVIGLNNERVTSAQSLELAQHFDQPRIYQHKVKNSLLPTRARDLNVYGKFLVDQKCKYNSYYMGGRSNALQIKLLQHQLLRLENEATTLLLRHISHDAPKSLMAVISPQAVGGWIGGPRPCTGCGAPCPKEFLLKKNERRSESDKSHPNDYQSADRNHPDKKTNV